MKLTKIIAALSSAAMVFGLGSVTVSAGLEELAYTCRYTQLWKAYEEDNVTDIQKTINEKSIVYSLKNYEGIAVIVPEDTLISSESIGLDCPVTLCNDAFAMKCIKTFCEKNSDEPLSDDVLENSKLYFIDCDETISEVRADKLCMEMVSEGAAVYAATVNITPQEYAYLNKLEEKVRFSVTLSPDTEDISSELSEYLISIGCENGTIEDNYVDIPADDLTIIKSEEICDILESFDEIETADYSKFYTESLSLLVSFGTSLLYGDATGDNLVNLYDAIEIAKYIMNISDADEDTVLLADINRDGVTNLYDAVEIAKSVLPE